MHLPFVKTDWQVLALETKLGPQALAEPEDWVQAAVNTPHHLLPASMSEADWAVTEAARARVAMMNEDFMMDVLGE